MYDIFIIKKYSFCLFILYYIYTMLKFGLAIVILLLTVYLIWGKKLLSTESWMIAPSVSDWVARRDMKPTVFPQAAIVKSMPFPGGLQAGEIVKCSATAVKYYLDPAGVKRGFQSPAAYLSAGGNPNVREVDCALLNQIPTGSNVPDPTIAAQSRATLRV
jgi:hypothetical protein